MQIAGAANALALVGQSQSNFSRAGGHQGALITLGGGADDLETEKPLLTGEFLSGDHPGAGGDADHNGPLSDPARFAWAGRSPLLRASAFYNYASVTSSHLGRHVDIMV